MIPCGSTSHYEHFWTKLEATAAESGQRFGSDVLAFCSHDLSRCRLGDVRVKERQAFNARDVLQDSERRQSSGRSICRCEIVPVYSNQAMVRDI